MGVFAGGRVECSYRSMFMAFLGERRHVLVRRTGSHAGGCDWTGLVVRPSNRAEPEQAIGSGKHHMGTDMDFTPDRNAIIGGRRGDSVFRREKAASARQEDDDDDA